MAIAQQAIMGRVASIPGDPHLPRCVSVSAGAYRLGEGDDVRTVMLEPFRIGRYPITVAQFAAFLADIGRPVSAEARIDSILAMHPATGLSYADAGAYCAWATARFGVPVRLPTGDEWEAAARGTDERDWPWGTTFDAARCACVEAGWGWTVAVDGHPAGGSPCGAEQMAGNVWEWTTDLAPDGTWRQVRGGSYLDYAWGVRSARVLPADPARATRTTGFRIVVTPTDDETEAA